MKVNWQKFCLLIFVLLLVSLFVLYFGFRFTGPSNKINIIKNDHLVSPGATVEFSFVPVADNIEGLVLYFDKYYYVEGEKNGVLNFALEYIDSNGEAQKRNQLIEIQTLSKGDRKVIFEPLKKSRGQNILVKIIADDNTLISADPGLAIHLKDANPDLYIDTAPRPIYHFRSREIANRIYSRFLEDKKFGVFYTSLLILNLLVIFALTIIEFKLEKKKR